MKDLKNWAIAILGIVCLGLYWSAQHKQDQLNTLERDWNMLYTQSSEVVSAADSVLNEVEDYIWDKYDECLGDTIWEGDCWDNYMVAREVIVSRTR